TFQAAGTKLWVVTSAKRPAILLRIDPLYPSSRAGEVCGSHQFSSLQPHERSDLRHQFGETGPPALAPPIQRLHRHHGIVMNRARGNLGPSDLKANACEKAGE